MDENDRDREWSESGYFEIVDRAKIFRTKQRYIEVRLVKDRLGRYYTRLYSKVKKEKGYFEEEKVDLARFPISPDMVLKILFFFQKVISEHGLYPHPTMSGRWIEPEQYYRIEDKYTMQKVEVLVPIEKFDSSADD